MQFFRVADCLELFFMIFFLRPSYRYKVVVFIVSRVTYEPGPWIWIRICNYFLYGFRKRFGGRQSICTFAPLACFGSRLAPFPYCHVNDFCILMGTIVLMPGKMTLTTVSNVQYLLKYAKLQKQNYPPQVPTDCFVDDGKNGETSFDAKKYFGNLILV